MPTLKARLRAETIARILALVPDRRAAEEAALAARFPKLDGLDRAATVLLFVRAFPEEIDTRPYLDHVLQQRRRLVCPRVDRAANRLILHEVRDLAADLRPGMLRIPEPRKTCPVVDPAEVDWALVPGLAYDPRGYRIGRGAGHYDRLLPQLRPDVWKWSLILDAQWVDEVPAEPHDVPLDGVASPSRTVILRR